MIKKAVNKYNVFCLFVIKLLAHRLIFKLFYFTLKNSAVRIITLYQLQNGYNVYLCKNKSGLLTVNMS